MQKVEGFFYMAGGASLSTCLMAIFGTAISQIQIIGISALSTVACFGAIAVLRRTGLIG